MAGKIKGVTIEIDGDTKKLNDSVKSAASQSNKFASELRDVERLLKLNPKDTVLLAQKQKLLADSVDHTKDQLNALKDAKVAADKKMAAGGEVAQDQYRKLQREIIKAENNLETLEHQASKVNTVLSKDQAIGNLKKIGATAGIAAAAAGVALVGMGAAAIASADELQRQADVTGLSAERLQELSYAGSNLGVELDTITGAQAKLTKSMAGAKDPTKGTGAAFAKLGIDVRDSSGNLRDSKVVMGEAFDALNGVGNETERDALAMQIFGKSAMEMNPLIKAGGAELKRLSDEARNNGAVMSNEAVAGLDTFGDTLDNLKASVLGSVGESLAKVMPQIQELLEKLMELPKWIKDNSTMLTMIGVAIGTVAALIIAFNIQQALLAGGMTLWGAVAGIATGITTGLGAAFVFLTSPIGLVILAIGAIIAIGILLYKNWDKIKAFAATMGAAISKSFGDLGVKIAGFFTGIMTKGKELYASFKTIGSDIVKGMWEGISAMGKWIKDKVGGFFQGITDKVKIVFGINSPSKVFAQLGSYTGAGFAKGLESTKKSINNASQSMASAATAGALAGGAMMHSGTIRVEGVNNQSQLVGVSDIIMNQLRREARRR